MAIKVQIMKDSGFYDMFIVYDDGAAAATAAASAKTAAKKGCA